MEAYNGRGHEGFHQTSPADGTDKDAQLFLVLVELLTVKSGYEVK